MKVSEVVIPKRNSINLESSYIAKCGRAVITGSRCSQGFLFGGSSYGSFMRVWLWQRSDLE